MNPFISVVIPTYNHARFLKRALHSLINQTFTNWEAIIIDNNSTDNTDEIVGQFLSSKIRLLKINNNGVIAASRNKGIEEAKGEWIAFLDSDDWWKSDKLQSCVNIIGDSTDFIYHDLKVVGQKRSLLGNIKSEKTRKLSKMPFLDMLINGNPISNSSVVVRKKILDQVGRLNENPAMIGAEDFNTWLKIANVTNKFKYIPSFLGYYEYHNNGVSRKDMSECYKCALKEFMGNLDLKFQNQITAHIFYMKARHFMGQGRFSDSNIFFRQSLSIGNFEIRIKSLYMVILSSIKILLK